MIEGGALGKGGVRALFLPCSQAISNAEAAQIKAMDVQGVYPVAVRLTPSAGRVVTVAMGYFWDTPYEKVMAAFKPQMTERLQRLRTVDWTVPVDQPRWEQEWREVAEILQLLPGQAEWQQHWTALQAEAETTLAELRQPTPDPAAYRRFVLVTRQARAFKDQLYAPAIAALIEAATR